MKTMKNGQKGNNEFKDSPQNSALEISKPLVKICNFEMQPKLKKWKKN